MMRRGWAAVALIRQDARRTDVTVCVLVCARVVWPASSRLRACAPTPHFLPRTSVGGYLVLLCAAISQMCFWLLLQVFVAVEVTRVLVRTAGVPWGMFGSVWVCLRAVQQVLHDVALCESCTHPAMLVGMFDVMLQGVPADGQQPVASRLAHRLKRRLSSIFAQMLERCCCCAWLWVQ